ncbi:hypothetical protein [Halodesulfovibrio sp. MK-HDV]|jgi:hypothetical protein|uniref:hypothetical protein n=1 Tax=Halodesulfovibrio sp. MK-HDV TaxID=2599925 RepID=UPI00137106E8|nr:hypothetical protein [Halodesulfovibrio sp. MK-HDV]KAF1073917.1 hypothetical protein MKHDV_03257 [Halodesulfovibrio sp. MK-HDV]
MSGIQTIESVLEEFKGAHYLASSVYVDPIVSVPHVLQHMFPLSGKNLLKEASTRLASEGMWASSLVQDFILEEKPRYRKRYIRSSYQPAQILHAAVVEGSSKIDLTVPVVRLFGPSTQNGYTHWGQLFFRCPVCGDVHHYSAREGFGDGDRMKQARCNESGLYLYHSLYEVRDESLVGHLPERLRKEIAIPE